MNDVDWNAVILVFLLKHNPQHLNVGLKCLFLAVFRQLWVAAISLDSKDMRKIIIYLRSTKIEVFVSEKWELYDK